MKLKRRRKRITEFCGMRNTCIIKNTKKSIAGKKRKSLKTPQILTKEKCITLKALISQYHTKLVTIDKFPEKYH